MSADHQVAFCRALYQTTREHGAPPVYLMSVGGGDYAAETKDGKILVESTSGCCCWARKFNIATRWLEKYGKPEPHN